MNSSPQHFCQKCMANHPQHYLIGKDCHHQIVECPRGQYFVKYQPGLNLPELKSKRLMKLESPPPPQMDLL